MDKESYVNYGYDKDYILLHDCTAEAQKFSGINLINGEAREGSVAGEWRHVNQGKGGKYLSGRNPMTVRMTADAHHRCRGLLKTQVDRK